MTAPKEVRRALFSAIRSTNVRLAIAENNKYGNFWAIYGVCSDELRAESVKITVFDAQYVLRVGATFVTYPFLYTKRVSAT